MLSGAFGNPSNAFSQTLIVPVLGLNSMIQPIASSRPGMKNGTVSRTSRVPRNGVSVRVTIQARADANVTASTVLAPINSTVVDKIRYVSGSVYART